MDNAWAHWNSLKRWMDGKTTNSVPSAQRYDPLNAKRWPWQGSLSSGRFCTKGKGQAEKIVRAGHVKQDSLTSMVQRRGHMFQDISSGKINSHRIKSMETIKIYCKYEDRREIQCKRESEQLGIVESDSNDATCGKVYIARSREGLP
jgi:hypothetical protein